MLPTKCNWYGQKSRNSKKIVFSEISINLFYCYGTPLKCQRFLCPPHRGYISFVNTCVTPKNWSGTLSSLETFDLCGKHDGQTQRAIILKFWTNVCIIHMSTGSGTFHISQIDILASWAHGTSDSLQISYLGLYSSSKCDYQKLSWLVHRVRYRLYIYGTWNFRFSPNFIFRLVY